MTEFLRENVRRTFDEDREMLEAQQTVLGDGDVDPAYKVAVKVDAGAMQGRRLLGTMIESDQRAPPERAASKPAGVPDVVPAG